LFLFGRLDGLFGNCQKVDDPIPDFYQHHLTEAQRDQLEYILSTLISYGYGWSDGFAQCIITRVLLTYRSGISYDLGECDDIKQHDQQQTNPDSDELNRVYGDINNEGLITPSSNVYLTPDKYHYNSPDEEYAVGIGRRGSMSEEAEVANFAQFLSGLSDHDISTLEKYVADDLNEQIDQNSDYGQDNYAGESQQSLPDNSNR